MIDSSLIKNNPEEVAAKLKSKGLEDAETVISTILLLKEQIKSMTRLVETYKQLGNYISETNAQLKKIDPELMILWKDEN